MHIWRRCQTTATTPTTIPTIKVNLFHNTIQFHKSMCTFPLPNILGCIDNPLEISDDSSDEVDGEDDTSDEGGSSPFSFQKYCEDLNEEYRDDPNWSPLRWDVVSREPPVVKPLPNESLTVPSMLTERTSSKRPCNENEVGDVHIFHSPVELSVLSENDWEPFAKTSVVCEERIVLPKLIPAPESNRCGKGLKPISGKAAHVGNKLVVPILRSDGFIKVSELSGLNLQVRGNVGRKGRQTSGPCHNAGYPAPANYNADGVETGRDNFKQAEWLTVTGVKLHVSVFWVDGRKTELDSQDEAKRRFGKIREHAQPFVDEFSPHYTDGSWGNICPRACAQIPVKKFLEGHHQSGFFMRELQCSASKKTGTNYPHL
jgi:hypothetical protein